MTEAHFKNQLNRLTQTFGANHYNKERVALIWREVKDLGDQWFTRTVDRFIGEERHPPLMKEFREEISKERERTYDFQRKRQAEENTVKFSVSIEESSDIISKIIDRINGKVSDSEFKSFRSTLDRLGDISNNQTEKGKI